VLLTGAGQTVGGATGRRIRTLYLSHLWVATDEQAAVTEAGCWLLLRPGVRLGCAGAPRYHERSPYPSMAAWLRYSPDLIIPGFERCLCVEEIQRRGEAALKRAAHPGSWAAPWRSHSLPKPEYESSYCAYIRELGNEDVPVSARLRPRRLSSADCARQWPCRRVSLPRVSAKLNLLVVGQPELASPASGTTQWLRLHGGHIDWESGQLTAAGVWETGSCIDRRRGAKRGIRKFMCAAISTIFRPHG
jgi:hypothetical protein